MSVRSNSVDQSIRYIIENGVTDVLTVESSVGFILTVKVPQNVIALHSGPSINGMKMTTKIREYLLKITVMYTRQDMLIPINLLKNDYFELIVSSYPKSTETANKFYDEAIIQQKLWSESIVGAKDPVCPNVYGISYDCGDLLFGNLPPLLKKDNITKYPVVYDYLKKCHDEGLILGAILMEYIPNSKTLQDVINDSDMRKSDKACINAGAQVVRLFLNYGIIHCDLHTSNVIVDESGMAYIIDFASVINLNLNADPRLDFIKLFRFKVNQQMGERNSRSKSPINGALLIEEIFNNLKDCELEMSRSDQMQILRDILVQERHLCQKVMDTYISTSRSIQKTTQQLLTITPPTPELLQKISGISSLGVSNMPHMNEIYNTYAVAQEQQQLMKWQQQRLEQQQQRLQQLPQQYPNAPTLVMNYGLTPISGTGKRHKTNASGITKNRRRKNKQKKTRFKKKRR
jgi:hypothetical protein